MSSKIKCLNNWDVESKHVFDVNGISDALYAGECRYGGGEKYVLYESKNTMGFDAYNLDSTEDKAKTLTAGRNDTHNIPVVCHNNSMMGFDVYNMASTGDVSKTLNSIRSDSDHTPVVCYGISAYDSNCMKSSNPHSGIYVAKTSRTLDLNGGNPACNQGGMIVIYDGQSCASNTETAYTIQASRVDDHHISVICHKSAGFVGRQGAKAGGWRLQWKNPQR